MIKLINKVTNTPMWVADDRVEEYKAAGHKLAASPVEKPAKVETVTEKKTAKKK